jgi:SAM-dependent methyltransferase
MEGASGVERHYDGQAGRGSTGQALAARREGVLIRYKRYANSVKRQLISTYARDATCLVDLGCGRGGDLGKWRDANVRHVVAIDISGGQLAEGRAREQSSAAGRRARTQITWKQHDMLEPTLAALVAPDLGRARAAGGADAVAAMFCLQFGFGSERAASGLLAQVSAMLRPGGVFFGTAPDAAAILDLLGGGQAVTLQPPEVPFVLRLARTPGPTAAGGMGQGLSFSLQDTVTQGSDALHGAHEYLVWRETLVRLAAPFGLRPLALESMLREGQAPPWPWAVGDPRATHPPALSEAEARIARLYFAFAFRKHDGEGA